MMIKYRFLSKANGNKEPILDQNFGKFLGFNKHIVIK